MGKKKQNKQAKLDAVEEAARAAQEAEDAELRAEIAALGGTLEGMEDEVAAVTNNDGSGSGSNSTTTQSSNNNGSSTSGPISHTYDKAALESSLEEINLDLPFRQKLAVISSMKLDEVLGKNEVHDDLKREMAFYQQAQASVAIARQTLDRQKVPYLRPDDYYAEMVKSDGHMQRIRDSLLFEQKKMAAFEQRKKNQEQKKFGKQLQHEKQVAKAAEKRATLEAIKQIRKRRGQNDESGPLDSSNAGQFDIRLENETKDAQQRQKDGGWVYDRKHKGASDGGRQKSYNNAKKDAKFGYGKGGRKGGRAKRNNETTDDAGNYGKRSRGREGDGERGGGRGGGGGGGGGGRGGKGGGGQRPGKKRRMNNRR